MGFLPQFVTVECERAVLEERPVPGGGSEPDDGATIDRMGRASPIEIPRRIQLVGPPLLLLLEGVLAGTLRHAVSVVLVAGLVALLLDPLVRGVERVPAGRFRIPRGLAVAVVYLGFAAAVALAIVGLATVVVDQTRAASDRVAAYLTVEHGRSRQTDADRDIDRLLTWLDTHRLERVQIEQVSDP